jgi:hypothetical protein
MLGASASRGRKAAPPSVKLGAAKEAPATVAAAASGGKVSAEEVWEVRPGGMLVQKRGGAADDEPSPGVKPVPTIRVKAKHAGVTHEIYVSSEASFGQSLHPLAHSSVSHRIWVPGLTSETNAACGVQGS